MTFKHVKFTDSPTMRSLEKMALGNGAPIEKKASTERPKKDMTPTNNVFENLTKLCSGLRDIGLSRYADELEHNYMNYKQADAAYLTNTKDSGEKMLQEAHPEGSPKISDSQYAVIENIIDQQLKTIKMVEKTPTGKLASSNDIIDAVKLSLGQVGNPLSPPTKEPTTEDEKHKARMYFAAEQIQQILPKLEKVHKIVYRYFSDSTTYDNRMIWNLEQLYGSLSKIRSGMFSKSDLSDISTDIRDMIHHTNFGGDLIDLDDYMADKRAEILTLLFQSQHHASLAEQIYLGKKDDVVTKYFEQLKEKPEVSVGPVQPGTPVSTIFGTIEQLIKRIDVLVEKIDHTNDSAAPKSIEFLTNTKGALNRLKIYYSRLDESSQLRGVDAFKEQVMKHKRNVDALENKWKGYL